MAVAGEVLEKLDDMIVRQAEATGAHVARRQGRDRQGHLRAGDRSSSRR